MVIDFYNILHTVYWANLHVTDLPNSPKTALRKKSVA